MSLSSTGQYQTAVINGGYIYTSSNYGVTWTQNTSAPSTYWSLVAISSTGQYQTVVINGGRIYTSSNYGVTWTQNTSAPSDNWQSVSISSTGQYQTAVINGGYIYNNVISNLITINNANINGINGIFFTANIGTTNTGILTVGPDITLNGSNGGGQFDSVTVIGTTNTGNLTVGTGITLNGSTGGGQFDSITVAGTTDTAYLTVGPYIIIDGSTGGGQFDSITVAGTTDTGILTVGPDITLDGSTGNAQIGNIITGVSSVAQLGNVSIYGNGTIYDVSGNLFVYNANVTGTANIGTLSMGSNITLTASTGNVTFGNANITGTANIGTSFNNNINLLGNTTIGNINALSSANILTVYGNSTFSNITYNNQINEKVVSTVPSGITINMDYNQSAVLYLTTTGYVGNTTLNIANIPNASDRNRSYIFTIVGNHYGGIITTLNLNGSINKPIYYNGGSASVTGSFPGTFTNYYNNVISVQQIGLLGNVNVNNGYAISSVSFFTL